MTGRISVEQSMNFDTMPAGREIDALVAERVMKWRPMAGRDGGMYWKLPPDYIGFTIEALHYSTDIAAAWTVVDYLRSHGYDAFYLAIDTQIPSQAWRAMFSDGNRSYEEGKTPMLAICRVALEAMNATKDDVSSTV